MHDVILLCPAPALLVKGRSPSRQALPGVVEAKGRETGIRER